MRVIRDTTNAILTQGHTYRDVYHLVSKISPLDIIMLDMQTGTIKEKGVNGFQNEDLIAVCIDRLERFQQGEFSCNENELALDHLKKALNALEARTLNRTLRNVESKYEK